MFFRVPGSYGNSPGEVMGLIRPYGKRGGRPRGGGAPPWGRIGLGEVGGAPLALSYSLSLSLFPSLLLRKGKGFLLGLGSPSRTPYSWRAPRGSASLPPSFTYVGRGHPIDTQVDCLAVCDAPLHRFSPWSYHCSA